MRTILLTVLLAMSFGMTTVSLLVIRVTVRDQVHAELEQDLQHSIQTYLNLERQRQQMLEREAALVADLPSLKSLMTTEDQKTIDDAGVEFWKVSGSDLMALADPSGRLITYYAKVPTTDRTLVAGALSKAIDEPLKPHPVVIGNRLYEVVAQPITFGSRTDGTMLGYVALGYAIDQDVAREVSEAAAADVAFTVGGKVLVDTLPASLEEVLRQHPGQLPLMPNETRGMEIHLGHEVYLAASRAIGSPQNDRGVQLVVMKSYKQADFFLARVNRGVLGIGLLSLLLGGPLAVSVSRRVTRPLEALVAGARALGKGEFDRELSDEGTAEVSELSKTFAHMREELHRSQKELVASERLATIGRMAASISHDLRHYLSSMYANAEFLSDAETPQEERDELSREVKGAVHGMTDLLDSLLVFSRTGNAITPGYESLAFLVEGSVSLVRAHPEARGVEIVLETIESVDAWVDAKKLSRAVFNLLLNACQAAKGAAAKPFVSVSLHETAGLILITICDNGPGVPPTLRETMFLPFVSSGKESGVGLGLTLAQHIAQEHGGCVSLEDSGTHGSVFRIVLPKPALDKLRDNSERPAQSLSHAPRIEV